MATIALYADKLNQMPGLVRDMKKAVTDYRSELSSLRKKTLQINRSICNLDDVAASIQASTQTQDEKADALDALDRKNEQFIADAVRIDNEVAELVRQRKDDFYGKYSYLKPECEKNGWEKFCDKCKKVKEWCKEHWKLLVTIVIVAAAVAVIVFFPAAAPIIVCMAKGAIFGALLGGAVGGTLSLLMGNSFLDGLESGAFGGAVGGILAGGMAFAFTGGMAGVSLTFGQTLLIGAGSSAGSSLISDLGDRFIKGADISLGQMAINMIFSAFIGAAFSGVFYGISKGWNALKLRLNSNQGGNKGVVKFTTPKGKPTAENIAQTKAYVKGCNKALKDGAISPTGRVSTKGALRLDASRAARMERSAASAVNKPYLGEAGHVPDTTWTGTGQPHSWLDLSKSVNRSLGRQALKYPIGYQPTKFVFESPLFNVFKFPSTWSSPFGPMFMELIKE